MAGAPQRKVVGAVLGLMERTRLETAPLAEQITWLGARHGGLMAR